MVDIMMTGDNEEAETVETRAVGRMTGSDYWKGIENKNFYFWSSNIHDEFMDE